MALFEGFGLRHWRNGKLFLATVTALFAAIVSIDAAWPIIEPKFLAHYVRDYSDTGAAKTATAARLAGEPTRVGLLDVQISLAKSRQSSIRNSLLSLEILLAKASDPEEKVRTQFQIRELQEEFTDLDGDVKRLRLDREKQ